MLSWLMHVCEPTAVGAFKWIKAFLRDPFRRLRIRKAYRAPSNGNHIAKLLNKARSAEEAAEIFDIFDGTPHKERGAAAYAAYAKALVLFAGGVGAAEVLLDMDEQGFTELEIQEAKDRFYFPEPTYE